MSSENLLPIVQAENIAPIVQKAPESYQDNKMSSQRCDAAGKAILDAINAGDMTDDLDQKAATFIDKARRTVKAMNERRTPVTKLFDQIRGAYTSLENSIDPTKTGTVAFLLQAKRNEYAAKKHAEEEERQRELLAKQQLENKRNQLKLDIEDDIKRQFQNEVDKVVNALQDFDKSLTLDNYAQTEKTIRECRTAPPANWLHDLQLTVRIPYELRDEAPKIIEEKKAALQKQLEEKFRYETETNLDHILDHMPSKKTELERIAKANKEEAEKLQKEKEDREAAEAKKREEDRKAKEEEEKKKADAQRQAAQMFGLFDNDVIVTAYKPKTKVTKKVHLLNPEGILPIISMWWTGEGCKMTVDELVKMFKKQITYVEKLANTEDPTLIEDESVEYFDDVKAK